MKVQGIEITDAQIDACISRMKKSAFKLRNISQAAFNAGVDPVAIERLADRLIQREKKAGNIGLHGGNQWKWLTRHNVDVASN